MTGDRRQAPRVRRPIAERVRDNLKHVFPPVLVPLDRTGDERIGDLLGQLREELERRTANTANPAHGSD